jgi:hypothetical protein
MNSITNQNVSVISWSQGGLDTQWALKYWPSTRDVTSNFIAQSPDFHGTVLAYILCPAFPMLCVHLACILYLRYVLILRLDHAHPQLYNKSITLISFRRSVTMEVIPLTSLQLQSSARPTKSFNLNLLSLARLRTFSMLGMWGLQTIRCKPFAADVVQLEHSTHTKEFSTIRSDMPSQSMH